MLIVSPHFPPSNAADMQRVRLLLPYLEGLGVEAEVLAVAPGCVAAPNDEWLVQGLPSGVVVHRTEVLGLGWSRFPGLGTLAFRALRKLRSAGNALLREKHFDLVYFSTTQFGIHLLGPYWKRRFGVPFFMDYQDPWVSDYYSTHPDVTPPGGRVKYAVARWISARNEPTVLRHCSGITSVSAAYPRQLRGRYSWLPKEFPVLVAPFPGDECDLARAKSDPSIKQSVFDGSDGNRHWVYVGRGGKDMERAVRGLFSALGRAMRAEGDRNLWQAGLDGEIGEPGLRNLRIHFVGTSYAAEGAGQKTIEPLAIDYGLEGIVREHTDRIPYSQTLRCLQDADALIVPGSDDPGYTASKIYPFLLSRKPMLAIFHDESSVAELIRNCGGSSLATFSERTNEDDLAHRIANTWLHRDQWRSPVPLCKESFAPHTARAQGEVLTNFVRQVIR